MSEKVLALYDFASKQEYIYRTSKIKEISGASAMMSGMYAKFPDILAPVVSLHYELGCQFSVTAFDNSPSDGEVLYDGGGNLMVLWKSFALYQKANEIISGYLLRNAPGLSMIACYVAYTGQFDDVINEKKELIKGDRTMLYEKNMLRKNRFPAFDLPAVIPFTQVDLVTFLPVTYKRNKNDPSSVYPASACSLSSDRFSKADSYESLRQKDQDDFDKDGEGMFAVIYIDGNSMGNKLIACRSKDYNEGVANLRSFSQQVNKIYVDDPIAEVAKRGYPFRKVIGGGDEITLICKAKDAFDIMKTYFDILQTKTIRLSDKEFPCTSCAGIAVFHAKAPFNVAYDIAEAACEEAKKKAHTEDGNYFCFYYCHSGITNTFGYLHKNEQEHASGKPYEIQDMERIDRCAAMLRAAGRANVKTLGNAAQISLSRYQYEVKRVNAYLKKDALQFDGTEKEMRLVYDISEFYDLWFAKEGENDEEETGN